MSKYIKLEDAIHNINLEVIGRKEYTGDMKANLFFALDDLPTIDIVHCKDCMFSKVYRNDSSGVEGRFCEAFRLVRMVTDDDYCSYGERKDNE